MATTRTRRESDSLRAIVYGGYDNFESAARWRQSHLKGGYGDMVKRIDDDVAIFEVAMKSNKRLGAIFKGGYDNYGNDMG